MGPKDREERQLMRQRGAGTRQVKNIGFDLILPGQENAATEPLQSIKSGRSRKTPQPELLPQRSSRRTPKPEKTQLERSIRNTSATEIAKKRGRPAKKTISDQLDDASTSHVNPAEGASISTKKGKFGKVQKKKGDIVMMAASDVQNDGIETTEAAESAAPSTGVKKRKKRKSIGQQATSRAKAAKARSPLKRPRQSRNGTSKPDITKVRQATDHGTALASEVHEGLLGEPTPSDGGEPMPLAEPAEVAEFSVSGVDSVGANSEKLQRRIAQKPKKRKRTVVADLPKKRTKASATASERAPKATKAPKTQNEVMPTIDEPAAVQSMEQPTENEAGALGFVHEGQDDITDVAKSREGKLLKRKRVTVSQRPKKRVKAGITPFHRESNARGRTSTAESESEAVQRGGKPDEVELDSMAPVPEEQEVTAEEVLQTQKPKPKRKKRKSIGQQRPKKKSVDFATPRGTASKTASALPIAIRDMVEPKPAAKRGRPRVRHAVKPPVESLGEDEVVQPSEPRLNSKPKASRGRPKGKSISKNTVNGPLEETSRHAPEDEEEFQAPVLPEKKKRGRPRKADSAQATSQTTRPTKTPASRKPKSKPANTAPKARAPRKNTIPITIYGPPSPTTSSAEDDPLSTSHNPNPAPTTTTTTTTTTTNAVDVLSQLCSELLSEHSSALNEQIARSDSPSELERRKETTDRYAQELASRLLQLTTTLNASTSLHSRVRAAAKEERGLKKELRQLQKEREDVKARKEEAMKERKKRELEDLLSGISRTVKRGWDKQKELEEGDAVGGAAEE